MRQQMRGGPQVKRLLLIATALCLLLALGILAEDGLTYKVETEYVETEPAVAAPVSVLIQNRRISGWGSPSFVSSSTYGPPFDLWITGSLPDQTHLESAELTNVLVEADGARLVSVPHVTLRLEEVSELHGSSVSATPSKELSFESRSFLSATPPLVSVSGTVILISPAGREEHPFRRVFHARHERVLSLGDWKWRR